MKILIYGSGVVGQATGKGFSRLGHNVTFYDINKSTLEGLEKEGYNTLKEWEIFYDYNIMFICTPEGVVTKILNEFNHSYEVLLPLIVVRSTVPIGTCEQYNVTHNPEFLREGVAEWEFMNPKFILIGVSDKEQEKTLKQLYSVFHVPIITVNTRTSEAIKLILNAYLSTQISFWNQIKLLCDKLNLNSHEIARICMMDNRVSFYGASMHGKPFGGKCLPKDLTSLVDICEQTDTPRCFFKSYSSD